jgi:hypothetical protein
MANFCTRCGIPLAIGNETDFCSQHGGPAEAPDAQMRCPFCSELILATAKKCKHCGEFLSREVATPTPQKIKVNYPSGSMYCTACGNVGRPRGMPKFELMVVIFVSVFLFFVPLMIYLFVRSGDRCKRCMKKTLIPLTSPVARSALARTH